MSDRRSCCRAPRTDDDSGVLSSRGIVRHHRKKVLTLFGAVLVLYVVTPVVARQVAPHACHVWSSRYVPVDSTVDPESLLRIREDTTVVKVPSYLAAWPHDGIALPGLVAVSDRRTLEGSDTLLWHEMIHQHQYRRDGSARFLFAYVVDWHHGLLSGCSFGDSYAAIGYEIETHELIRGMRLELGGVDSPEFTAFSGRLKDPDRG